MQFATEHNIRTQKIAHSIIKRYLLTHLGIINAQGKTTIFCYIQFRRWLNWLRKKSPSMQMIFSLLSNIVQNWSLPLPIETITFSSKFPPNYLTQKQEIWLKSNNVIHKKTIESGTGTAVSRHPHQESARLILFLRGKRTIQKSSINYENSRSKNTDKSNWGWDKKIETIAKNKNRNRKYLARKLLESCLHHPLGQNWRNMISLFFTFMCKGGWKKMRFGSRDKKRRKHRSWCIQ